MELTKYVLDDGIYTLAYFLKKVSQVVKRLQKIVIKIIVIEKIVIIEKNCDN